MLPAASMVQRAPAAAPASSPEGPPKSVTHFGWNMLAVLVVLATMYVLRRWPGLSGDPALVLCAAVALPIVLIDVFVHGVSLRASTGMDWDHPRSPSVERTLYKVVGLAATLAPFAFAYWLFPEYGGSFYDPFYHLLRRFWIGLVATSVTYLFFADAYLREPRDVYWHLGRFVLGHRIDLPRGDVANHYRGWLVKAFFFPLMFVWLNGSTHNVVHYDLSKAAWSNLRAYDFLYDFIFFIDLLFSTVGYALCFRFIDTHIRTAEPTFLGWGVALFCYEPFFSGLFEKNYVHYRGPGFGDWLQHIPALRWSWAIAILALITVYVLATVAFGVRFSNLTHRGILTNGPYRFTKHPAYLSKNLSWWLISVPFIPSDGWPALVKHCIALAMVNFIYFMRAKTEERHLSRDPTYVAYALWMNEHGFLRFLNRAPLLKYLTLYRPPVVTPAGPAAEGDAAPVEAAAR